MHIQVALIPAPRTGRMANTDSSSARHIPIAARLII
jgi:hypothetical protein